MNETLSTVTAEDGRRVQLSFPVDLVVPGGLFRRVAARGVAERCDDHRLTVRADAALAPGTRVRLRFPLPEPLAPAFAGIRCEFPAEVVRTREPRSHRNGNCELFLRWERPLPELARGLVRGHRLRIGAILLMILAAMFWLRWMTAKYYWYDPLFYTYTLGIGAFFLSRFYLSSRHEPPQLKGLTPSVSVVIAVRNEEGAIARTVESCFAADYPEGRREVIVVDDGSTDATPRILREISERFPQLRVFTLPPSGKRYGMAKGVREATGEIVTFVDSDTLLHPTALRQIVAGFEDPSLGAVSGFTGVENAEVSVLTRLQELRYLISYDLLKASESLYGCVSCCPGCLSAYRRSYVLEVLDAWLGQTFLGAPATFGDDRSLTNYILRKHRVLYNPNALSTTLVPENWPQFLRQQVRWKKSWLRETLIASGFMWQKAPVAALSFFMAAACSLASPAMVLRAFWLEAAYDDTLFLHYVAGLVLLGLSLCLFVHWRKPRLPWLIGMLLVAYQVVLLGPQTYYAILTMRRNHWGTR